MTETIRIRKSLTRVGSSKAIILPNIILQELGWEAEDEFYLEVLNGVLTVKKIKN